MSRLNKSLAPTDMADGQLAAQLALYKPVATIRDMQEVFMYINVSSDTTCIDPIRLMQFPSYSDSRVTVNAGLPYWDLLNGDQLTGATIGDPITQNPIAQLPFMAGVPWYLPIGTQRRFNIANLINSLCDIRVPRDKYVFEINLAECQLESDTAGWNNIVDRVFYVDPGVDQVVSVLDPPGALPIPPAEAEKLNPWVGGTNNKYRMTVQPTFRTERLLSTGTGTNNTGNVLQQQVLTNFSVQQKKQTQPETLFVRIKELSNGQPYNWSVTNSGNYSVDKNHQVVLRHGDFNVANLTLEFGHLVATGGDPQDFEKLNEWRNNGCVYPYVGSLSSEIFAPNKNKYVDKNSSTPPQFVYLDYNMEHFNVVGTENDVGNNVPINSTNTIVYGQPQNYQRMNKVYYIDQYINPLPNDKSRRSLLYPENRPPFYRPVWLTLPADSDGADITKLTLWGGTVVGDLSRRNTWDDPQTVNGVANVPTGGNLAPPVTPYLQQGTPLKYNQQVRNIMFRFSVKCISLF